MYILGVLYVVCCIFVCCMLYVFVHSQLWKQAESDFLEALDLCNIFYAIP